MSQCRGLSIGQWSPIYNVLFQLLLARLLIVKIRILLDCANIFNKNFHILC